MSTLFLFGAGASRFSGECDPYPPPLGPDLFKDLQAAGGVAAHLDPSWTTAFAHNFEEAMLEFARTREHELSQFLRDIALYFVAFAPGPKNLYVRLLEAIPKKRRRFAVFATLNYELLLELAANNLGYAVSYHLPPIAKDNIAILKPHGSCNFLPDLGGHKIRGITFETAGLARTAVEAPVKAANRDEVRQFCLHEDSIAPALAIYAPGKQVFYSNEFVQDQQRQFEHAVLNTSRIYVAGVRVNPGDAHIWGPLANARAPMFYVGPDSAPFYDWAESVGRRHLVSHFAHTFEGFVINAEMGMVR